MKILKQKEDFRSPNGIPSGNLPAILQTSNGRLACKKLQVAIFFGRFLSQRSGACVEQLYVIFGF